MDGISSRRLMGASSARHFFLMEQKESYLLGVENTEVVACL
jgi:hypothetical protein